MEDRRRPRLDLLETLLKSEERGVTVSSVTPGFLPSLNGSSVSISRRSNLNFKSYILSKLGSNVSKNYLRITYGC